MTRTALDSPAAKSLRAWGLLLDGKPAGRVLVYHANSGGATADLNIYAGPLEISIEKPLRGAMFEPGETLHTSTSHGWAGGGGYDKASAAIADAAQKAGGAVSEALAGLHGAGCSSVVAALEKAGYQVLTVLA